MATKPQTYPQQIQELKAQLEHKDQELNDALQKLSFVEEMQNEITHLNGQLQARSEEDRQGAVNNKAQWTDLEQRATSAEQGLRNSQALVGELQAVRQSLETQLRTVAIARDKEVGKDKKLIALEEVIRGQSFEIAKLNQRLRDVEQETVQKIATLEKAARYHASVSEQQRNQMEQIRSSIEQEFSTEVLRLGNEAAKQATRADVAENELAALKRAIRDTSDPLAALKQTIR